MLRDVLCVFDLARGRHGCHEKYQNSKSEPVDQVLWIKVVPKIICFWLILIVYNYTLLKQVLMLCICMNVVCLVQFYGVTF